MYIPVNIHIHMNKCRKQYWISLESFSRNTPLPDNNTSFVFKFQLNTKVEKITKKNNGVIIETSNKNGDKNRLEADVVLISVGRKPFTNNLNLENIGVELDKNGRVKVNKNFETNIKTHYIRHLKRKNPCKRVNDIEVATLLTEIQNKSYINRFENDEISENSLKNPEKYTKLNHFESQMHKYK